MSIELLNMDCMDYMRSLPDKAFDMAIVDPPYGIERFKKGGSFLNKYGSEDGAWNNERPSGDYFEELFRVSINQVIWGGNYFSLPVTGGWIAWDKQKNSGEKANFADFELAWTSFLAVARVARIRYDGFVGADTSRIHPTQKPIKLYEWLLASYAKPGQRILDTHLGSASSAIAAHYFGCDFVGTELDPDYYAAAKARFDRETAQHDMFAGGSA